MRCCYRIINKAAARQQFDCRTHIKFEERLNQKRMITHRNVSAALRWSVKRRPQSEEEGCISPIRAEWQLLNRQKESFCLYRAVHHMRAAMLCSSSPTAFA